MPRIRPVSDLRNHFAEITKEVQSNKEPVFLTKNGVGSLVVMSMDAYEDGLYESGVYEKLCEAELLSATTTDRKRHEDIMESARNKLKRLQDKKAGRGA